MAKRLLKTMILPLTVMATALAFIACDGSNPPDVKYKVTYVIGANAEGTAPTETDKAFGEKFKLKSADGITCEGATFGGWNDGNMTYQVGDTYTMPSKAVTFTAQWTPDGEDEPTEYTVTYKYGDAGEDVVKENQTAENYALEAPAKYIDTGNDEYYKLFAGWTIEDGDGTVYLPDAKLTLTGDTVFTAQWVDFDDDNMWFDTTYELQLMLLNDKVGAYIYIGNEEESVWTYFTYAVSGTAITLTPANGNPVTGTLDNGELTISIKYGMTTYQFQPEEEPPVGKPTVTFNANGGTGTAPVIDDADIVATTNNQYNIVLPQCTYTAPANKEFDKWEVIIGNKSFGNYAAGTTFKANEGENLTLKAVWKDAYQAPAGVVLYGNCKLPTKSFMGMTQGGETVVQIVIDTTAPQNVKIKYMLADDVAYSNDKTGDGSAYAQNKPDVYGDDALYYGAFQIGAFSYNIVVKADLTALYLCDSDDELLDNGEFTANGSVVTPPAPVTYTVTYANPNGATGELPATVTVDEGAQVTLEAATLFTKAGWTFQGWQVTGYSALRAANTKITVTEETTITPVFGIAYTDSWYDETWTVRDDGYVSYNGYSIEYTQEGNIITIPDYGYRGRLDSTNKTLTFLDAFFGLTATAENGAILELDGDGGVTLGVHNGTYTDNGSYSAPVLTFTFGTVVVEDVNVIMDGYTAVGLNINATITLDGTDYVFGAAVIEPVEIPQQFVGTFTGMVSTTAYVVEIATDSITVTVGSAQPVEAEVTDYNVMYKVITFKLGQEEWYIDKYDGFGTDVDSIRMTQDYYFDSYSVLGRQASIEIPEELYGTYVGGDYTVTITADAITVKVGNAAPVTAVIEEYDEYEGFTITLNGDEYYLMPMSETQLWFASDDSTVDETLTLQTLNFTLEDFAGASSSAPKEYGYASLDAAGYVAGSDGVEEVKGNAFYTLNSIGTKKISYKIQVYWVSGKLAIKLVSGFTSQTLVKDSASNGQSVTSENDVANDYYVISNPNTITIKFGVDAEGRKTITLKMAQLTLNDETIQAQEITWTEMAA